MRPIGRVNDAVPCSIEQSFAERLWSERKRGGGRSPASRDGTIRLVIDSGCTMNCHPFARDLINHRPSNETMSGIDGKKKRVKLIGDLPVAARDHRGRLHKLLIRNVRCVPSFTDTLISVDRLFEESGAEARFANYRTITAPTKAGRRLVTFPFQKEASGLFVWTVAALGDASNSRALRSLALPSLTNPSKTQKVRLPHEKEHDGEGEFHRSRTTSYL